MCCRLVLWPVSTLHTWTKTIITPEQFYIFTFAPGLPLSSYRLQKVLVQEMYQKYMQTKPVLTVGIDSKQYKSIQKIAFNGFTFFTVNFSGSIKSWTHVLLLSGELYNYQPDYHNNTLNMLTHTCDLSPRSPLPSCLLMGSLLSLRLRNGLIFIIR